MRYYLFLPNGYPERRAEDESERLDCLMQHPILGVYESIHDVIAAFDKAERAAIERIQGNGCPQLPAKEVRRLIEVKEDMTTLN